MKAAIYALLDPRDGQPRYIGKTTRPRRRLCTHLRHAHAGRRTPVHRWVRELLDAGLEPRFKVLVEMPSTVDWRVVERAMIGSLRDLGQPLLNVTDGGEGGATYGRLGKKNTPAHRLSCSIARTGVAIRQRDPDGKRAAALKLVGERRRGTSWGRHTEATKQRLREAALARRRC